MIKAVLFDMDGVLVDSIEAWFRLFNRTLKHFGKEEFEWEAFLNKVWGGPIERDAEEFFGKPLEDVKKFYFDNFDEFKKNLKLFPNAREILIKLKDKNLKLGLVTNTPQKQANKLIEYLKLGKYFDAVVGGDEVEHGKPAPDMILKACERLGVNPKETAVVGDTIMDMMSCKAAGCLPIGFKIDGIERVDDLIDVEKKIFK